MKELLIATLMTLLATIAKAEDSSPPKFVAVRGGASTLSAFGSKYTARESTLINLGGNLQWGLNNKWSLRFQGDFDFNGEAIYLGTGVIYHFIPLKWDSSVYPEGAVVTHHPMISYHAGITIGMNRVQLPLTRQDGTQADLVLAALIGPTLHIGAVYSLTPTIYADAEFFHRYSIGPNLAATQSGVMVGLSFRLP